MSAGNDEVRYTRLLRRVLWFALGVAAATLGMVWATVLATGQAAAQPVNVPAVGVIDVPDQVGISRGVEPGLHLAPAGPQQNSSIVPRVAISAPSAPAIVRPAVGLALTPAIAHPAATPVPHAVEFAPDLGIALPAAPSVPDVVRTAVGFAPALGIGHPAVATAIPAVMPSAVASVPIPGIVRSAVAPAPGVAHPAVATTSDQAPVVARAFTFTPAPAPVPEAGATQPDLPGLPPVLDIPQVRQFLSAPQFRGLSLPGLNLPTPQAQSTPQAVPTPRETTGERALDAARSKLGHAYRYGSAGPDAFDCSGLVQWSYRQAGVTVPRTSYGQLDSGTPVPLNQLQPGDVVSFYGGGHSAIYEGGGRVIHASTDRTGVIESPIGQMPVTGARRF